MSLGKLSPGTRLTDSIFREGLRLRTQVQTVLTPNPVVLIIAPQCLFLNSSYHRPSTYYPSKNMLSTLHF